MLFYQSEVEELERERAALRAKIRRMATTKNMDPGSLNDYEKRNTP